MNRYIWAGILIGLAALCYSVSLYVSSVEARYTANLISVLENYVAKFQELNDLSAHNLVAPVVKDTLRTCAADQERTFNALLDRLAELSTDELTTLQTLFDACAADIFERRAMMGLLLEETLSDIETIVTAVAIVQPTIIASYPLSTWREIVALEIERAQLLRELIDVQAAIIMQLRSGNRTGKSIADYVKQAAAIKARTAQINDALRELRTSAPPS